MSKYKHAATVTDTEIDRNPFTRTYYAEVLVSKETPLSNGDALYSKQTVDALIAERDALLCVVKELRDIIDGVLEDEHLATALSGRMDSFTLQPAIAAIAQCDEVTP